MTQGQQSFFTGLINRTVILELGESRILKTKLFLVSLRSIIFTSFHVSGLVGLQRDQDKFRQW